MRRRIFHRLFGRLLGIITCFRNIDASDYGFGPLQWLSGNRTIVVEPTFFRHTLALALALAHAHAHA
ncbi:MAG: hypothetical protein ACHQHL_15445, partial [Steroidobacterales bacterium]